MRGLESLRNTFAFPYGGWCNDQQNIFNVVNGAQRRTLILYAKTSPSVRIVLCCFNSERSRAFTDVVSQSANYGLKANIDDLIRNQQRHVVLGLGLHVHLRLHTHETIFFPRYDTSWSMLDDVFIFNFRHTLKDAAVQYSNDHIIHL